MRKILHRFNMVEIVLAIGVVAIGVTGVMALLPPSLNANRDVAADAFVEEAASKVSALLNLVYIPEWKNETPTPSLKFKESKESDDPSDQPQPSASTTKDGGIISSDFDTWKIFKTTEEGLYWFESGDGTTALHASFRLANLPDKDLFNGSSSENPSNTDNIKRIFVEFSWPVTVAMENRQKRLFVFDISK